jgi:hypothetical protein
MAPLSDGHRKTSPCPSLTLSCGQKPVARLRAALWGSQSGQGLRAPLAKDSEDLSYGGESFPCSAINDTQTLGEIMIDTLIAAGRNPES